MVRVLFAVKAHTVGADLMVYSAAMRLNGNTVRTVFVDVRIYKTIYICKNDKIFTVFLFFCPSVCLKHVSYLIPESFNGKKQSSHN